MDTIGILIPVSTFSSGNGMIRLSRRERQPDTDEVSGAVPAIVRHERELTPTRRQDYHIFQRRFADELYHDCARTEGSLG